MNQLQQFIEKAFKNEELMKKVNDLSMGEPTDEEIISLAAEHGFTITAEELEVQKSSACSRCVRDELEEEDLESIAGGGGGPSRWDHIACMAHGRTRYECVGFLYMSWCLHYTRRQLGTERYRLKSRVPDAMYWHTCQLGAFSYEGNSSGQTFFEGLPQK